MNQIDKFFILDDQRNILLKEGKAREFLDTYSQIKKFKNKNTSKFWSKILSEEGSVDFMRIDRISTVAKILLKQNPKNFLNIGVGKGELENHLYQYSFKRYGIDITLNGLLSAGKSKSFKPFVAKLPYLPFRKSIFDAITVLEVLEHIPHYKIFNVLNQIKRIMKNNARLTISVPINENYSYLNNPNGHLRRYSEEIITQELIIAGFEIESKKVLYAFSKNYYIKKYFIRIFQFFRKPNVIIIVARKKT